MKNLIIAVLLSIPLVSLGQTKVNRGSLGIGIHAACPQSDLKTIEYDDGWGFNFSYLSRKFPYQEPINFQIGARMDFGNMQSKTFDVELATPTPDDGEMRVKNNMYGLFLVGRININDNNKVTPFANVLIGHRNYSTGSTITANNPQLNPDYESVAYNNRIIFTKRFHYGVSLGVSYKANDNISLESSITYTIGDKGAVQPLADVTQEVGRNEVHYDYKTAKKTDMLLINLGVRFELWKKYYANRETPTSTPNTPSNTRYKDPAPTKKAPPKTSDPIIKDKPADTNTPKKKAPLEIKSDGPKKKDGGVGH